MIVEERIYTLQSRKVPDFLKCYEAEGMEVQLSILGRMVGYYSTEVGPLNQIVHMWAYDDLADRTQRRARLAADPRWLAFVDKVCVWIITQENKIRIPAPFFARSEVGAGRLGLSGVKS